MSKGPDPAMVADWFTWGGVLFVAVCVGVVWVVVFLLTPKRRVPVLAPAPAHPCALHGHTYRAQPVVWRCVHCSDERVPTDSAYSTKEGL